MTTPRPASPHARLVDLTGLTPLSATTTCADPQAAYQRLRQQWGVIAPVELEPGVPAWLVMGYPETLRVVRDERMFARDPHHWRELAGGAVAPDSGLGPMMFPRDNAYFADGAEHRRLRAPLAEGIAGLDQHRMARSISRICADLIAGLAPAGVVDLVADYAAVVPMLTVADWFGIDVAHGLQLQRCLIALFGSGADSQAGHARFQQILTDTMRARATSPAADLTTAFLDHPNLEGEEEVLQQMVLMISAGYETTTTWIAQTLRVMLTDPRFCAQVRGGRRTVDDALDEVLWVDPPMANMPARFALADCELGGRNISRGDALILGLAAANPDPRVHTTDSWAGIGNRSHLAWSAGPHVCPAHDPARLITRTAVETALHHLPGLTLTIPADHITVRPSPWTRCPATLPARFTPVPSTTRP